MGNWAQTLKWLVGPQKSEKKISCCEVIIRHETIIVFALVEIQRGAYRASIPITKLPQPVKPEELGRVVLETLDSYKSLVTYPGDDELKKLDQEVLSASGFSSWRKMSKDAKRIGIESDGNSVTVTPTVAGPSAGYADITELAITSNTEPGSVGGAILEAATKCTTTSRF